MDFSIFSGVDINSLTEEKALAELQNYVHLANSLRTKYQNVHRVVALIDDAEEAKKVSFAIAEFNKRLNELNQAINTALQEKTKNLSLAAEKIKEFDKLFNSVEPIYEKHKKLFLSLLRINDEDHDPLHDIKTNVVDRLNSQWSTLQNNLTRKIEEGIQSVLNIKLTLGVTGVFKDQIEGEITRNREDAKKYFDRFMLTLLAIPVLLGSTYILNSITKLEWQDALFLRLSIVIPLIWLAKWYSTNYTYSQLAAIKFDHLNRLLGEGAPTIAKLVEADQSAKSEVYKRLAELFLDINDLTSFAGNQPKHPAESINEVLDMHKKLKELIK